MNEPTIKEFIDMLYDSEPIIRSVLPKEKMIEIYNDWLSDVKSDNAEGTTHRMRHQFDYFEGEGTQEG